MARELVLDTETTGLDYENGHRIVEIGIVELENHLPTGGSFHCYINPERDSDKRAEEIHGLSREFLNDKPKFADIANEFIDYLSDSKIIIHNAAFDVNFINSELTRCNMKKLSGNIIIDTLTIAKEKFLGQSVSLDSLCRKYNIDLTGREIHGAIKDAKLLASVYLELIGGKQSSLDFEIITENVKLTENKLFSLDHYNNKINLRSKKNTEVNEDDYKLHLSKVLSIKDSIWKKINN